MLELLTQGISRLASKSNNAIFHLKQEMGGGKTHIMIIFRLIS
jgi:predicted AAA+ superfamily ATPase